MSDCGVCIGTEADGTCEVYRIRFVKAKKQHRCDECAKTIESGERYEYHFSVYEGEALTIKTCTVCAEIRSAFTEPGSANIVGELWSEMRDYAFPGMTTGCFDRLETPEAKAELRRRWVEWKGLPS